MNSLNVNSLYCTKKGKYIGLIQITLMYIIFSTSCVPIKDLKYINDIDRLQEPSINPREQKLIMPFDKLFIKVLSIDEKTNQLFNSADELRMGGSNSIIGYLVDEDGNIIFPFVGKINVGGITLTQASTKIQEALSDYVSKVSVVVKFVDTNITVMGEVQQQGIFAFSQDKLNIYEAIALGGGLTNYGDRKNIILIRQDNEKIMHFKINLTDSKIAGKEYFYVQANDVIIVEPMRKKSFSYSNNAYATVLSSITTFIAILIFSGVRF